MQSALNSLHGADMPFDYGVTSGSTACSRTPISFWGTAASPALVAWASAIQAVMGAISDFLFLIQASDLFLLRILVSYL